MLTFLKIVLLLKLSFILGQDEFLQSYILVKQNIFPTRNILLSAKKKLFLPKIEYVFSILALSNNYPCLIILKCALFLPHQFGLVLFPVL